jgi:opacity protein-like surface antigen
VVLLLVIFTFILPAQDKDPGQTKKKERKYTIEFSLGMGRINPRHLYDRSAGIDELVSQYAGHYDVTVTSTGEFKQNKLMIPINVSATYPLKNKFYLRAGLELAFSNSSSEKEFELDWSGGIQPLEDQIETQQYGLTYKVSYFMPQVGAGYRISEAFDIYGALGLGFTRFTYTEAFTVTMGGDTPQSSTNVYKAKGTAMGIIFGAKYRIKLKKINAFIKLETLLLKAGLLKGSKTGAGDDVSDGTFYYYDWNPYLKRNFPFWDVFETEPSTMDKSNVAGMSLNLSTIRIMLGISF